ncbi:MAG: primosomal protein N' [Oscillospiraceae bacterium]|nr:primosomal protein N' [Oscillospiraceae bacterium]
MKLHLTAGVAVEGAAFHFDRVYTYLIPAELAGKVLPGCRVRVPFGRSNAKRLAVVLSLGQAAENARLKPIVELLDPSPLLDEEGLWLLRYLREQTFCSWFDALKLLLPAGLGIVFTALYSLTEQPHPLLDTRQSEIIAILKKRERPLSLIQLSKAIGATQKELDELVEMGAIVRLERSRGKVLDEKVTMLRLLDGWETLKLSTGQRKAASFLAESDGATLKELLYFTGLSRAVAEGLRKKGGVEFYDFVLPRNPYAGKDMPPLSAITLTAEQQAAVDRLTACLDSPDRPALLYGVTGSGKTQVYLTLIEEALARGRGAIVMVPEISLTTQTMESFHARFGGRVAVLHSGLSLGERMDEWRRIKSGGADIVVGTRSAVFAPMSNIGLIVIDEEQEHSYKSDKSPRFHAREIARARCRQQGALLLLASATPSIESYHAAKIGQAELIILDTRYGPNNLPVVEVIDMGGSENLSDTPSLSARLREELHYNLHKGEQSILLLNRRGHSTLVRCSGCGDVAECPSCSVAMTYHAANGALLCHYCGHQKERATCCALCGSELLRYMGEGTQKLEETLRNVFPDARILRVDMDTTMSKFAHQRHFSAFAAGEYDIMIGTQMVAKGLNFPKVTLVGVLGTDLSLYANDFRSFERTFALLTQVVGRSGRGALGGRAFIQTYCPESPVINLAAKQDYPAFFADEDESRRLHIYPPYCQMAGIGFVGPDRREVAQAARSFAQRFGELAKSDYPGLPLRLLGPTPAELAKSAGKYRFKLILKCKNNQPTRALIDATLRWFYENNKHVGAFVDMHYNGW